MNWKFCALIAIAALASRPAAGKDQCKLVRYAEMPVTMAEPGRRPHISGTIDGHRVTFMLDSGAFYSILGTASAERLGLSLKSAHLERMSSSPFGVTIQDSAGNALRPRLAIAKKFSLLGYSGGRIFKDVEFLVLDAQFLAGEDGIIGQNVIGSGDAEFDFANGVVRLYKSEHCFDQVLAYWHGKAAVARLVIDKTTPLSPELVARATLNGKPIRVLFDTGATRSVLTLRAADRAGVQPQDKGVSASDAIVSFGSKTRESWIGRFDTLDLGGEVIKNARLAISDVTPGADADLVLGADFFLSHRIYVARKRGLLWFTYNGGPVFDIKINADSNTAGGANSTPRAEPGTGNGPASDTPTDAAGYRRRGAASASRLQYVAAIADFGKAIALAPSDPKNYYQRGLARWHNGQLQLALTDLNHALDLNGDDVLALAVRGAVRLQTGDVNGAHQDFDKARSLAPDDAAVQLGIADYFSDAQRFADAIEWLDVAIGSGLTDTERARALNSRCWARAMLNQDLDQALADCNAALRKNPHSSYILDSRGLVYLRQGQLDKAIDDYKHSLEQQPSSFWTRYGLGLAELEKGLQVDGRRDIKQAIAGDPDVGQRYKRIGLSPPGG